MICYTMPVAVPELGISAGDQVVFDEASPLRPGDMAYVQANPRRTRALVGRFQPNGQGFYVAGVLCDPAELPAAAKAVEIRRKF